ncbi:Ig-like domain-containing protein [Streptomyces sp. CA-243310]|uniref:Ig-like domain-containing protein n=1 Tax=Streptomyces sp. CA-243310 TaxID=3240056 RepID=UPI003D8FB366
MRPSSGQSVTFTATVQPEVAGPTPTGSVEFVVDSTPVVTVPLDMSGTAQYTTSDLEVGLPRDGGQLLRRRGVRPVHGRGHPGGHAREHQPTTLALRPPEPSVWRRGR